MSNFPKQCKTTKVSKVKRTYSTYSKTIFSKDDFIKKNENYCEKSDLKLKGKDRSLPIMYWLPKRHKRPILDFQRPRPNILDRKKSY